MESQSYSVSNKVLILNFTGSLACAIRRLPQRFNQLIALKLRHPQAQSRNHSTIAPIQKPTDFQIGFSKIPSFSTPQFSQF